MSEFKGTPGPWFIDDQSDDYEMAIVGHPTWPCTRNGKRGVWDVCKIETDTEDTKANARLIAAAPDLLEALRALLPIARLYMESGDVQTRAIKAHDFAAEMASANAAIAKALRS